MEKQKYFIQVDTGEISRAQTYNNNQFTIYATDEEIWKLRECFAAKSHADWGTFWRAHVPFKEYHNDEDNDAVDHQMMRAYKMIYELGDVDAREHVRQFPFFDSMINSDEIE